MNIFVTYTFIAPGWGQNNLWSPNVFRIINIQSIFPFPASFHLQMTFLQFSSFKCIGDTCWPCRKIGQYYHMVIIYSTLVPDASRLVSLKSAKQFRKRIFLNSF